MKIKATLFIFFNLILLSQESSFWGKEFIFAIPHNETPGTSISADFIGLIITASEDTEVKIYTNNKRELFSSFFMNKGESLKLEDNRFKNYEIDEYGGQNGYQYEKCFYLESDEDVTLVLVNSKDKSTDAMSLIPVESWAYHYKHLSYYNFNEDGLSRATGFFILASEDQTEIEINFPFNRVSWFSRVNGTRDIDQFETLTLNSKMVYNISASSFSSAGIDLSGTEIKANKPIAIISYHQRTKIPFNTGDGRDILLEMPLPVTSWGKKYITSEFLRNGNGDFFRILCKNDNTTISYRSYDKNTRELISSNTFTIDGNELFEFNDEREARQGGIKGLTIWESDKPFMPMQYSYSADWDGIENADPFMTSVFPAEQFVHQINFTLPDRFKFVNNYVNLIFELEEGENFENTLFNGRQIVNDYPDLISNKIPETDFYYLTIELDNRETNYITSKVKFGAYLYGFGDKDSYGYSLAGSFEILDFSDTSPPLISYENNCGTYQITSIEKDTVIDPLSIPVIKESGFQDLEIEALNNFELMDEKIIDFGKVLTIDVINKFESAFAILRSSDKSNNIQTDTIIYKPIFDEISNIDLFVNDSIVHIGDTLYLELDLEQTTLDLSRLELHYDNESLFLLNDDNLSSPEFIIIDDLDSDEKKIGISFLSLLNSNSETKISLYYRDDACGLIEIESTNINLELCNREFLQVNAFNSLEFSYLPEKNQIIINSELEFQLEVKIYDSSSNMILNRNFDLTKGINYLDLDFSLLMNKPLFLEYRSIFDTWTGQQIFIE